MISDARDKKSVTGKYHYRGVIHLVLTLAKKIGQLFFKGQFKSEIEQIKFEYGLLLFVEIVLDIMGFVVIGFVFKCLDHLAVYLATFAAVRVNAGGYHAKTFAGCFITTCVLALTSVRVMTYYSGPNLVYLVLCIVSGVMIIYMSPLDSVTKPLSKRQKQKCKVKTIYVTIGIIVLSSVLYVLGTIDGFKMMSLAVFAQMLTMIPIFYKYKRGEKYYENVA